MDEKPPYWFPAKTYGWGWGPPCTWQGWIVLAIFLAILPAGLILFKDQPALQALGIVGATVVLIGVCWLKGEPPRWRWGRARNDKN